MYKVYTSPTCSKCQILKERFGEMNIEYNEVTVTDEISNMLHERGFKTLPIIDDNGELMFFTQVMSKLKK